MSMHEIQADDLDLDAEEIEIEPQSPFLTKQTFAEHIESVVLNRGISYFDAVLEFSEESDKEPAELLQYMSQVILDKIRQSAIDSELIRGFAPSLDSLLD